MEREDKGRKCSVDGVQRRREREKHQPNVTRGVTYEIHSLAESLAGRSDRRTGGKGDFDIHDLDHHTGRSIRVI